MRRRHLSSASECVLGHIVLARSRRVWRSSWPTRF